MKTQPFFLKIALCSALLGCLAFFHSSCKSDDDMNGSGNISIPDSEKFELNFSISLSPFFLIASTNDNEIILDTLLTEEVKDFLINYPKTEKLNITVGSFSDNGTKLKTVTGVESGHRVLRNTLVKCDDKFNTGINVVNTGSLYIDDLPTYDAIYSPSSSEYNVQYDENLDQLFIRGLFEKYVDHVITLEVNGGYRNYVVAQEDWTIEGDGDFLHQISYNDFQPAEIVEIASSESPMPWQIAVKGLESDSIITTLASWRSEEKDQHDDEVIRLFLPQSKDFTDYRLVVSLYNDDRLKYKISQTDIPEFPSIVGPVNSTIDMSSFAEKSYQLNHSAEVDLIRTYYYFPFVNNRRTSWEVYHLAGIHAQFDLNILTTSILDSQPSLEADLQVPAYVQVDLYDYEGDITPDYQEGSIYAIRKLDCLPYAVRRFYKDF